MRAIILAAGQSKRFQEEGYRLPKQFLTINWRDRIDLMVNHIMLTVSSIMDLVAVVPENYVTESIGIGLRLLRVIKVGPTKGPAHTAKIAMDQLGYDENVLFMDSDVLNHPTDLFDLASLSISGVLVSESYNPNCSYVDKIDLFTRIKEKQQISEYAVRGAYFVHKYDMAEFAELLTDVVTGYEEPFLSHVFDKLSTDKMALKAIYPPIDWGTPEAVRDSGAIIIGGK